MRRQGMRQRANTTTLMHISTSQFDTTTPRALRPTAAAAAAVSHAINT